MKQNINLFEIGEELQKDFPLIPKKTEEYCSLLKGLVKSMGIQTNEITDKQEKQFGGNQYGNQKCIFTRLITKSRKKKP